MSGKGKSKGKVRESGRKRENKIRWDGNKIRWKEKGKKQEKEKGKEKIRKREKRRRK